MTPRAIVFVLLLLLAPLAHANQIRVDRHTVRLGENFTVTIELEGEARALDRIPIPLRNVELIGPADVRTEIRVDQGVFSRRKVIVYRARPLASGVGEIGPIRLSLAGGTLEIPGVTVQILPPVAPRRGDPGGALRGMELESREAVVLDVEVDRESVALGEQVVVTWVVYARDTITSPGIIDLPALEGFWTEEIPVGDDPSRNIVLGGGVVTRAVVRKVALFPLRSGQLPIEPLEVRVGVMRSWDPFGIGALMNRSVVNVARSSPPLTIEVAPVPEQAELVGAFRMECSAPKSVSGGPVSFSLRVEGDGNLRSAPSPRFLRGIDAEVEIEGKELEIDRDGRRIVMSRRWTVLLMPESEGDLEIPPLGWTAWNPETGTLETLVCDPGVVTEIATSTYAGDEPLDRQPVAGPGDPALPRLAAPAVAGALVAAGGIAWLAVARRRRTLRPLEERLLARREEPRNMREDLREMVRARGLDPDGLYRAETPLADSYRALSSLLDVLEKEPWERERSAQDLDKRARELVRRLSARGSGTEVKG